MNKRRELRIMWSSNGPWTGSGYASFTRDILRRMHKDGWIVACNAFYGLQGQIIEWEGITCYPQMADPWGGDSLIHHSAHFRANVAFTMQDIWPLNPQYLSQLRYWIPYVPIDKTPTPPNVLNNLRFAYRVVSFSDFGRKELQKSGFASTFITEGVDLKNFYPTNQAEARKELNIPQDAFVFAMVAANKENPPRKSFQEALEAFKLFHDKHPEAFLLVSVQQPAPTGFPIAEYAHFLKVADRVMMIPEYTAVFGEGTKSINRIYNAADVLLHPSQTEGFGLCIVEAQAAGTPAVIQDCHSMPELIVEGVTGEKAKTAYKRFTNDLSFVNVPDPQSIYEAMERLYVSIKKDPLAVEKACRDNVVKNFDIDKLYQEKWAPFLETLQDEILGPYIEPVLTEPDAW